MATDDEIKFEDLPKKTIEPMKDSDVIEMRDEAIKKLEKSQIDKTVRAEAGIIDIPKDPDKIPKELPQYLFKVGSKALSCQKFNIDEDEAKLLSKHLSILIGNINSKVFSLIIIFIVIVSKASDCWDAIGVKLGRKKKPDEPIIEKTQDIFNQAKNSEVTG